MIYPFDDQTWISSDTHFFHENIGHYCDRPDGWQETIIENWNRLIQPEEIVFHVGDLALGKKANIEGLVPLCTATMTGAAMIFISARGSPWFLIHI